MQGSETSSRPSSSKLEIPDFGLVSSEKRGEAVSTPRSRTRSRTLSQVALPFKSPTNEKSLSEVARFTSSTSDNSLKPDKARQETRKLLNHILNELQKRPRPAQVWDLYKLEYAGAGLRKANVIKDGNISAAAGDKTHRARSFPLVDSDSDDESSSSFSPDATFDLLNRLKDVLILSKLKQWRIFDEGSGSDDLHTDLPGKSSSFRFRRSSFQSNGRRSRSFSPSRQKKSSSDLLARCITILGSIVLEDCRFQFSSIRLARPPNALQALTLDVSQLLIYLYRGNPKILYDIGLAIIPAFSSFPESTHGRLLGFFEDALLRTMLQSPSKMQEGYSVAQDDQHIPDRPEAYVPPIVAIQVDEAQDEIPTSSPLSLTWQQWCQPNAIFQGILSSNAPAQSLESYYVSSVIGPMLAAILDNVDLSTQNLALSHRIHKLFHFLADYKPDMPLFLLEVAAFHSSRARYSALSLLQTFWSNAFGHLCMSKPFPLVTYSESLRVAGAGPQRSQQGVGHPHSHQFVPWYFSPHPSSVLFEGSSLHDCHSCLKQIKDFGLMCPFCMCVVHSNCYDAPEGSFLSHYPMSNEPSTQRVAVHRFSYIRPRRLGFESKVLGPVRGSRYQHSFRLANIFTLSVCGICHLPLWGYISQGYRCSACNQYVHSSCLHGETADKLSSCHSEPDAGRITVKWSELRSSFIRFYHDFPFQEEDLPKCTHEELSIYWSLLWIQLHLLKYGIASGSIIVVRDQPLSPQTQESGIDDFELQHLIKLYGAYLESPRLHISAMFQDLLKANDYIPHFRGILFDWPILLYITSVIKSSPAEEDDTGSVFLNVAPTSDAEVSGDFPMYPAEVLPLACLRDALGRHFNLFQTQAACIMLGHLRHSGFFDSVDLPEGLFRTCDRPLEIECSFALPLGLDLSADVELLVVAVERCLEDLDIAVNESGFLLLIRKLWPNSMASDYALARLTKSVLAWILAEDDNLVIILREYVAKHKSLPGVPSSADSHSWPNSMTSRSASSGSINNGNDYVTCRKALLVKYASRWLFALHCQDAELYASLLFDSASDIARSSVENFSEFEVDGDHNKAKEITSTWADKVLRYIMKICQSSVVFSVEDDLLLKWLDIMPVIPSSHKPLYTLPRLLNREAEGSARWTVAFDATVTSFEHVSAPLLDPWRIVNGVASRSYEGFRKSLSWLRMFALSGVDIPTPTFLQVFALARDLGGSFEDHAVLADAVFMSIWVRSLGRQELHKVITDLHDKHASFVLEQLGNKENVGRMYHFIRLTLSSFLLLYGCERAQLQTLGLVEPSDIEGVVSRRKVTKRASLVTETSIEEINIVGALAHYIERGTDELRCLIAKALVTFLMDASLLTSHEMETFILKNSYPLTRCAWDLYDMHAPEVNDLRATLLLRVLVADARPFEQLLQGYLDGETAWELRFEAATRLFQIILDITKSSFVVEGRQFRTTIMETFFGFFSCLWSSGQEEVRLATDTWAQSLQPSHHQSMTLCFSESLSRAPIPDKLNLVSFLLQLRTHFPTWKVLSWDAIIETLIEDDFMQRNDAEEGPISAHLSLYGISSTAAPATAEYRDPDAAVLQSSLILLSLQMIADGISVDLFSFLKIKLQLVRILGFPVATLVPAPSGHSFHVHYETLKAVGPYASPCLQGLMALLDAHRSFELSPSAMAGTSADDDATHPVLVGSVILDVFFDLFNHLSKNLGDFTYLQIKMVLQSLIIVFYKHDVDSVPLHHLRDHLRKAVRGASDILLGDIGSELKQLVLTAIQAFRSRWSNYASSRDILNYTVTNIIKFLSASNAFSDDVLFGQGMSLLEDILTRHSTTFYYISKRTLEPETFSVLRLVTARNARNFTAQLPLRDVLLKDTLHVLMNLPNDPEQKHILENLLHYVNIVHNQGYSSEGLSYVGESFVTILRNASELVDESFNPNPLLLAAATLIQYNKALIRGFLHNMETAVRIALVRFNVSDQALRRLLQVTSTLYRRTASETGASANERNSILSVVIEILSDGLRGKCRVTLPTLKAIIESLSSTGSNYLTNQTLARLATDAFFFLQISSPSQNEQQDGLNASKAACFLVLCAGYNDVGFLSKQLNDYALERNGRHALTVRVWNMLALAALENTSAEKTASQLLMHLPNFSVVYHASLRSHIQSIGLPQDMVASDINQAFIAIKLWLLLARKSSEEALSEEIQVAKASNRTPEDRNASLVWNELWPPFEKLVGLSEADAEVGEITPIATLVWSSIADIFLFLGSLRSTISLEVSSHFAVLNRMKNLGKGDSFAGKFVRTVSNLFEPPPEMTTAALVAQASHELLAAEKLHALETRRELGRVHPDRSRRDVRVPTG
ncbi:hypothetical protein M0805_006828 [Coniferiporia weirii]|nr:hypothetical protein M0805_006828 [Coniferiporia weirii]